MTRLCNVNLQFALYGVGGVGSSSPPLLPSRTKRWSKKSIHPKCQILQYYRKVFGLFWILRIGQRNVQVTFVKLRIGVGKLREAFGILRKLVSSLKVRFLNFRIGFGSLQVAFGNLRNGPGHLRQAFGKLGKRPEGFRGVL